MKWTNTVFCWIVFKNKPNPLVSRCIILGFELSTKTLASASLEATIENQSMFHAGKQFQTPGLHQLAYSRPFYSLLHIDVNISEMKAEFVRSSSRSQGRSI